MRGLRSPLRVLMEQKNLFYQLGAVMCTDAISARSHGHTQFP